MPEPAADNQIIGLVRFSYLSRSGFTREFPDSEARQAYLNDPERLERRFRMFEALTLPSLQRQTDPAFQCLFLTGTGLAPAARQRLEALVATLPGGRVVALPPMHHYPATQRALALARDPVAAQVTSFRLDDDDALALDFIARLKRLAGPAAALGQGPGSAPVAVAFNSGLFLELGPGGNRIYPVLEKTPLGIGLALVAPAASDENIFARNHRLLPVFYNTYSTVDAPMFIRTVHADNDSTPHVTGRQPDITEAELDRILAERFGQTRAGLMGLAA